MVGKQSPIDAVRAIFEALDPLDAETRERAIVSAMSLLGMSVPSAGAHDGTSSAAVGKTAERDAAAPIAPVMDRPQSLIELVQEKSPATNPQRIAVFAFYRERVEAKPRFSRHDLERYFPEARVPPPANFDRDFGSAVTQGWIHEDKDQSYLTTKGLEAVEAGFGGKRTTIKSSKQPTSKARQGKKKSRRKSPAKKPAARGRSR